jgi:riboflavin synthase
MFTGIIECLGKVVEVNSDKNNRIFVIEAPLYEGEIKVDQSISHNGVCLTVTAINGCSYDVTAIDETLQKANLGQLRKGDFVNLERCMRLNDRLDGHIVQGHVDITAECVAVEDKNGSWLFSFSYDKSKTNYCTVEKGSVCVNGVSLTVVDSADTRFSVAIIPYTYKHTNFNTLKKGDLANVEFDIVGKYVSKLMLK